MKLSEAIDLINEATMFGSIDKYHEMVRAGKVLADALRWRKWPEEKPEVKDKRVVFLVRLEDDDDTWYGIREYAESKWNEYRGVERINITHWLPIPEVLP